MNLVPQTWHGYGFSPVWMRICALRWATWTNRALHVSHLYGFSPLWIRKWVFKFAGRLNWASQIGHLYGLLPKNKLISVFEGYIDVGDKRCHQLWLNLTVFFLFSFWWFWWMVVMVVATVVTVGVIVFGISFNFDSSWLFVACRLLPRTFNFLFHFILKSKCIICLNVLKKKIYLLNNIV